MNAAKLCLLSLALMSCATPLPNVSNPAIQGNHELSGRVFVVSNQMAGNQLESRGLQTVSETTSAGILDAPRGSGGFGYDPHFQDNATSLTGAELPLERKNELSHRGQAMRALLAKLGALRAQE